MLKRFEAHQFRCFERVVLEAEGRSVGLVGPNAAGKTSVLEGLYFLSYGRSFRVPDRRQLVRAGAGGFRLLAEVSDGVGPALIAARWADGKLAMEVNGRSSAGIGEVAGRLRVHLIDPSVHLLIEGGPQERRRLLDTGVFHVEPTYLSLWRQYRRALRQRNAALRGSQPERDAGAWDREVCAAAVSLDVVRHAYVRRWSSVFRAVASGFGLLGATLEYRRGWPPDVGLENALQAALAKDAAIGATSVGPHRADVAIQLEGRSARRLVSRGQQKLLASALVLSQLKLVHSSGEQPLLLLDDPGAELDVDNLGKFLGVVGQLPVQMIATATFPAALEKLRNLAMFHVKQNGLVPML